MSSITKSEPQRGPHDLVIDDFLHALNFGIDTTGNAEKSFNWGVSVKHFEGLSNEQSEAVGPLKNDFPSPLVIRYRRGCSGALGISGFRLKIVTSHGNLVTSHGNYQDEFRCEESRR